MLFIFSVQNINMRYLIQEIRIITSYIFKPIPFPDFKLFSAGIDFLLQEIPTMLAVPGSGC